MLVGRAGSTEMKLWTYQCRNWCVRAPQDYPQVQRFIRTHKTKHMVILMTKIHYIKKNTKQSQQREKPHGTKSRGDQAQTSKGLFQVETRRTFLIPPVTSCGNKCEMLFISESLLSPQDFY